MADADPSAWRLSLREHFPLDLVSSLRYTHLPWVITRALEHFVAGQAWQVEEIHKALAEADAGDFVTAEAIEALNNKYKP